MALTNLTYSSVNVNNAGGASAVNIQDGGNSITVDGTVAATQSGTWVLGANSGVDIGDVTVNNAAGAGAVNIQDGGNSITVDGTVAATQSGAWSTALNVSATAGDSPIRAEDTAFAGGEFTMLGGAVRSDTLAITTSADGDIQPLKSTDEGALWVALDAGMSSVSISSVIPGTGATNLGKAEDAAAASGDVGVFALAVRQDTLASSVSADGDYAAIKEDSDGAIYTRQVSNDSTNSNVAGTATSTTLSAASSARIGATVYNDSSAILYVLLENGGTASATAFTVKMQPEAYFEVPFGYTGDIIGVWASATGAARISELTA